MKIKKVIGVLSAAGLIFSLGACGQKADSSQAQISGQSSEQIKTIRLIHYMGEQTKRDALAGVIAAFEAKNPNIKVDAQIVDVEQFITIYKTRINANDAPDMFFGAPRELEEFIDGGHFMDISDAPFLSKVLPEVLEECEVNGKYYGMPIDVQVKGVFYNQAMFEERGIAVPKTKDAFIEVCDQFVAVGVQPLLHAYNFTWAAYQEVDSFLVPMAKAKNAGNLWRDSQSGTAALTDNPTAVEAFEFFGKLASYQDPGDLGLDQATCVQNFANGDRPMYINGGWIMGDAQAANPEGKFSLFATPWSNNAAENKLCVALDDAFIVSNATQYKDEIYQFLDFWMTEEASSIWMRQANLMSSYKDARMEEVNPFILTVKTYIDSQNIAPKAGLPDYTAEFIDSYTTILQGYVVKNDQNIPALLAELTDEAERIRG